MNSRDYWAKREQEALKHYVSDEAEYDKRVKQIHQNMLDAVQKEIDSFYGKYADKEGITIAEAKKRVTKLDIAEYERKAKRYVKDKDFSAKANEEMRLYNLTMKVNRLEMLKANIGLETIAGFDEMEKFMGEILQGRTMEELERQAGILGKTVRNNAQKASAIVNASFHNAKFSDRVWMYQDLLRADLGKLLQSGLIQGKNPRVLAREIKKKFETSTYNAERLMRTELARVQTEAQKQSFIRNGFDFYEFIVNGGCCDICAALDGKHFKVEKMMPGENAPPMHPHCRCSTAAWEDDAEYEAWLDYLDKGGTTKEWEQLKQDLTNEENNDKKKSKWDNDLPPRGQVKEKIPEDDLYDFVAKELGIPVERAAEYADAIMSYTDTSQDIYGEIRRYQRNDPLQFLSKVEAKLLSDDIEEYIQKAPRWNGGETFRGSTVSDKELATYAKGHELDMGGTASWSATRSVARDFALRNATSERPNSVIYHCEGQSKGTGIRHISIIALEDEVLCSKESKYVVDHVEVDEEYIHHVYLKEV